MMTLGITGRSGCGKSTVTAVFAARNIPLADADQLSREILLPGSPLLPQLAERFGADIIREDGTLDRRLLADRAFATPEGKAALDALTHPAIVARIRAAKQAAQTAGAPLFEMCIRDSFRINCFFTSSALSRSGVPMSRQNSSLSSAFT